MKQLALIAAVALAAFAGHAYAGEPDSTTGTADNNAMVLSQATSISSQPAAPLTSNVMAAGKTRADVFQELIRAEKDGSLARLNAKFYSGG